VRIVGATGDVQVIADRVRVDNPGPQTEPDRTPSALVIARIGKAVPPTLLKTCPPRGGTAKKQSPRRQTAQNNDDSTTAFELSMPPANSRRGRDEGYANLHSSYRTARR
jgi:hypothetical protein